MIDAPANQHGAATTPATQPISRPRIEPHVDGLGAYRLYECLGTGGYASVYRARRLGEPDAPDVALKRLHPHLLNDDVAVRAFGREARLAYLLDHPTIRRVYSLARKPTDLFMTMEYIDGVSVFDLLRRASAAGRQLPLSGILALLHRLCSALHYAHELVDELGEPAGFVHRDVSPSNLMIATGGRLKLIDMGVASTRLDAHATGNKLARIQGKYGYMAPEVLYRAPVDRRADVFSVGVVAWELLTLYRLYPVSKPPVDLELVRSRPFKPPSTFNRRCPAELDLIVTRALAKDPRARWQSCAAMGDALITLVVRLSEPTTDAALAALVELVDDPVTRLRLARGTSPRSPAVAPASELEARPATSIVPSPRRRRALAVASAAGIATLVSAGIEPTRFDIVAPVALLAPPPHTPPAPSAPRSVPPPPAPRPLARPPVASTLVAPPSAPPPPDPTPVRLDGAPPRSWSAAYPYRARLCVDIDGTVRSVVLLDGPSRLEGRITRALRRWRYAPLARPTCFEVHANVEKVPGK